MNGELGGALLIGGVVVRAWWRRVSSGSTDPPPALLRQLPPGDQALWLLASGTRPINVIKAIRGLTGLGLDEAKAMVDGAPALVAGDLGDEAAHRGAEALRAAGAEASIEPTPVTDQ